MALSDKAKAMLRSKLPEVKILIIDEISMVSRNLFYKAHAIVLEIFTSPTLIPFAGLSSLYWVIFYNYHQLEENQNMPLLVIMKE